MTAGSVTAAGRRAAARLMTDAGTLTRRTGTRTWDPESGTYTQDTTTVYSGPCRVRVLTTTDRTVQAGEEQVSLWRYLVSVPFNVEPELHDDFVLTASADPTLVGRLTRVVQVTRGTHVTARRMVCEEKEAP